MTARTEILRAARALAAESVDGTFSPIEVVELLRRWGSPYPASTIRTHVVAAMCVNAPDNHGAAVRIIDLLDVLPELRVVAM